MAAPSHTAPPNESGEFALLGGVARDPAFPSASMRSYHILGLLGAGGMSRVYRAFDANRGITVALKLLFDELAGQPNLLNRFRRESDIACRLSHPNIVHGLACGFDEEQQKHFLVLDYVDGPNLLQLIELVGPLPVGAALHIVRDIALGLQYLHQNNLVHRDVKPENILLDQSGRARLSDLGLAKHLREQNHLTAANEGFGSPFYMPYEQALNAGLVDERSDIFALGATLYHTLVGDVPFKGESHREIVKQKEKGDWIPVHDRNPQIPPSVDTLLARMLDRDPRRRFADAQELLHAIEQLGIPLIQARYGTLEAPAFQPASVFAPTADLMPTRPELRIDLGELPCDDQEPPPSAPLHLRGFMSRLKSLDSAHTPWSLLIGLGLGMAGAVWLMSHTALYGVMLPN